MGRPTGGRRLSTTTFRLETDVLAIELVERLATIVDPSTRWDRPTFDGAYSIDGFRIFRRTWQHLGDSPTITGHFRPIPGGTIVDLSVRRLWSAIVLGGLSRLMLLGLVGLLSVDGLIRPTSPGSAAASAAAVGATVFLNVAWIVDLRNQGRDDVADLASLFDASTSSAAQPIDVDDVVSPRASPARR